MKKKNAKTKTATKKKTSTKWKAKTTKTENILKTFLAQVKDTDRTFMKVIKTSRNLNELKKIEKAYMTIQNHHEKILNHLVPKISDLTTNHGDDAPTYQ